MRARIAQAGAPLRWIFAAILAALLFATQARGATLDSRLSGLATRGLAGSGNNVMIAGFFIQQGEPKTVLVRALGPGLSTQGIGLGSLEDPVLRVYDSSGALVRENDDWSSFDSATMEGVGLSPPALGSRDAAIVLTLPAGAYTAQVSGSGGATGIVLLEVYDVSGPARLIAISTRAPVGQGDNVLIAGLAVAGGAPSRRILLRAGGPMLASLLPAGTAVLSNPVLSVVGAGGATIAVNDDWDANNANAAGALSAAFVQAGVMPFSAGSRDAALVLDLAPGAYSILVRNADSSTGVGLVEAYDITADDGRSEAVENPVASLFIANLAVPTESNSTAFGTATLQLAPDATSATLSLTFYNLSGTPTSAHLAIDGVFIRGLPARHASGIVWNFRQTGAYSATDLAAAVRAGRVMVSIDTVLHPEGELLGAFTRSTGASDFTVPPAPPAVALGSISDQDAARFLAQATFGATRADMNRLKQVGYSAWMAEQVAIARSVHRNFTMADFERFTRSATTVRPNGGNRQAAWWEIAVNGPDQLRQRVAFALSEIFVISDQNGIVAGAQEGAANYYDLLARNAFGNFRTLIEEVTLSPMMGIYLSSLRNAKGTVDGQGNILSSPDENYAREVMQLFTIGLRQLNPDGTLRLDSSGEPIPTYDQQTISELARVLTGWSYASTAANPDFRRAGADYINPMRHFPAFHDDGAKTIVNGRVIPAGQGGPADLRDALDTLFYHPNVPPFISRQLIQRLVTSNPSRGYVYRVAQVFSDNGSGVRGDLGAVVRAILLDYEARSPAQLANPAFGKLKEPLLRATALFRAMGAASNAGRLSISNPESSLAQAALRSPTVFNFFEPDYAVPGTLASAGLFAPEFQILTDTTAITVPNFYYSYINRTRSTTDPTQQAIGLDYTSVMALARTPKALVDEIALLLAGGNLTVEARTRIVAALQALPAATSDVNRVRVATYLVLTCASSAVQK